MKMKSLAISLLAVFALAGGASAEMNPNVNDAWKLTDTVGGGAEIVFEPVIHRDAKTNLRWMTAVSCDPNADACAKFRFNIDGVKISRISPKTAKAFLAGDWAAF